MVGSLEEIDEGPGAASVAGRLSMLESVNNLHITLGAILLFGFLYFAYRLYLRHLKRAARTRAAPSADFSSDVTHGNKHQETLHILLEGERETVKVYERADGTLYTPNPKVDIRRRGDSFVVEKAGQTTPEERIREAVVGSGGETSKPLGPILYSAGAVGATPAGKCVSCRERRVGPQHKTCARCGGRVCGRANCELYDGICGPCVDRQNMEAFKRARGHT